MLNIIESLKMGTGVPEFHRHADSFLRPNSPVVAAVASPIAAVSRIAAAIIQRGATVDRDQARPVAPLTPALSMCI